MLAYVLIWSSKTYLFRLVSFGMGGGLTKKDGVLNHPKLRITEQNCLKQPQNEI